MSGSNQDDIEDLLDDADEASRKSERETDRSLEEIDQSLEELESTATNNTKKTKNNREYIEKGAEIDRKQQREIDYNTQEIDSVKQNVEDSVYTRRDVMKGGGAIGLLGLLGLGGLFGLRGDDDQPTDDPIDDPEEPERDVNVNTIQFKDGGQFYIPSDELGGVDQMYSDIVETYPRSQSRLETSFEREIGPIDEGLDSNIQEMLVGEDNRIYFQKGNSDGYNQAIKINGLYDDALDGEIDGR